MASPSVLIYSAGIHGASSLYFLDLGIGTGYTLLTFFMSEHTICAIPELKILVRDSELIIKEMT